MGMRRRRLTWALVMGLAGVFLGERVFSGIVPLRVALSGGGGLTVLASTLRSVWIWRRAQGDRRRVDRLFALLSIGCAVALVGYLTGTVDGVRWLGLDFETPQAEGRFRRGFLSVSSILMAVSLVPMLAAQWAAGRGGAGGEGETDVSTRRVTEVASAALSVALAAGFLMLAGYIAAARDVTFDASYFKTSSPGSAVQGIVGTLEQPLGVLLFFPEIDAVKDEVAGYFRELDRTTGRVRVEEHDRLSQPTLAEEYDVSADGTIVLTSGDRSGSISVSDDLDEARARLRVLDRFVGQALLELTREQRVVYLTTGHGELNDPIVREAPEGNPGEPPPLPLTVLRALLGQLNYEVRDLGVRGGLAERIPDDAAAVLVMGPRSAFLDEELEALSDYLHRGGSMLLALEPGSDFRLGPLREDLGVEFQSVGVVDDQRHMRQRGGVSDRRLIVTDLFATHPAVSTAGRRGAGSGILLPGPGYLTAVEQEGGPQVRFLIGSLRTSFPDRNGNLEWDEGSERRGTLDLAAAVQGPPGEGGAGMRALVFADAEMFSDGVLASLALNAAVAADGVRWLGREEAHSGEIASEEDVPIVHTQAENVAWFYAIILGAPLVILALGAVTAWSRRRTRRLAA